MYIKFLDFVKDNNPRQEVAMWRTGLVGIL